MKRWRISAVLVGWLATASPALAETALPHVGDEVSSRLLFLDGTVLLPPGTWSVAATDRRRASELDGADVTAVVLLQTANGRVTGVVLAQGNASAPKNPPSLSSECWSADAMFTAVATDDASGGACAAVLLVATQLGQVGDSAWGRAQGFAAARGWSIPAAFMVASLRSVDRTRLMDVRYALAVLDDQRVGQAMPCIWSTPPAGEQGTVERMGQGLTNFSSAMLPIFEIAGHSRLAEMGTAPPLTGSAENAATLMQRLKQSRIDELLESGALSPLQAEALTARAAEPAESDPLVKELLWRSGYKTLTYKSATFIDTSVIYYLFVPDLPLVLVGAAITNVLGMPIVYINDFVWSYFGLKASQSKQPFALPTIGTTCVHH